MLPTAINTVWCVLPSAVGKTSKRKGETRRREGGEGESKYKVEGRKSERKEVHGGGKKGKKEAGGGKCEAEGKKG